MLAGAYPEPSAAALAAAAAVTAGNDNAAQAAALQQTLLSQYGQVPAMQQVNGATATMINRYQAASCAALANAAACQRQQQQHQAAAAAAAAAALAAAANSDPASLLQMAQAAQAYQAAAAAAAAAAASINFPHHAQFAAPGHYMGGTPLGSNSSNVTNSSSVSSPTSSSSHPHSMLTVSTFCDLNDHHTLPGELPISSSAMAAAAAGCGQGLYDPYFLQQALANVNNSCSTALPSPGAPLTAGSILGASPWSLPASTAAAMLGGACGPTGFAAAAAAGGGGGYPSGIMPTTPDGGDAGGAGVGGLGPSSSHLDALAQQLTRQMSLSACQG